MDISGKRDFSVTHRDVQTYGSAGTGGHAQKPRQMPDLLIRWLVKDPEGISVPCLQFRVRSDDEVIEAQYAPHAVEDGENKALPNIRNLEL